eukprot:Unigene2261_Nuclearia_a/m.7019 Unigene2261_Nuclearia_a/g.7019  ORF Unigene2261_Nuclearia_a/g.7019 Unigene2261_Nuclearia_a/m.7019 type:complete len:407 (-) Unigene2261_Nuclearia_a:956-2176(-)
MADRGLHVHCAPAHDHDRLHRRALHCSVPALGVDGRPRDHGPVRVSCDRRRAGRQHNRAHLGGDQPAAVQGRVRHAAVLRLRGRLLHHHGRVARVCFRQRRPPDDLPPLVLPPRHVRLPPLVLERGRLRAPGLNLRLEPHHRVDQVPPSDLDDRRRHEPAHRQLLGQGHAALAVRARLQRADAAQRQTPGRIGLDPCGDRRHRLHHLVDRGQGAIEPALPVHDQRLLGLLWLLFGVQGHHRALDDHRVAQRSALAFVLWRHALLCAGVLGRRHPRRAVPAGHLPCPVQPQRSRPPALLALGADHPLGRGAHEHYHPAQGRPALCCHQGARGAAGQGQRSLVRCDRQLARHLEPLAERRQRRDRPGWCYGRGHRRSRAEQLEGRQHPARGRRAERHRGGRGAQPARL